MSKRFRRGLVVGKFSPLHRGHELVINRAREECDEVFLLSYSKPEMPGCEAARRDQWLSAIFPNARHLAVTDERLRQWVNPGEGPLEVPANDADETTHRRFCGFLCQEVFNATVDAVFTSEDYGDGFAEELTQYFRERDPTCPAVTHIQVDRSRRQLPVSGTLLRENIHASREWLSPLVYASFVQRVCLLGGESSGKSTLAEALAREFNTSHVTEYGREHWNSKSGTLAFEDMQHIAEVQVQHEETAAMHADRLLFCDTSPLTTFSTAITCSEKPIRHWRDLRNGVMISRFCAPPIFHSFKTARAKQKPFECFSTSGISRHWRNAESPTNWSRVRSNQESHNPASCLENPVECRPAINSLINSDAFRCRMSGAACPA
jgi:HTH-type transcriptional regulator, transcriptional repressor of NAD biosynthesis genes